MPGMTYICHFCPSPIEADDTGMPYEEVAEVVPRAGGESVLAHIDCVPGGVESAQSGENPDWKMA